MLSSPAKKVKKDYFTGPVKIQEISAVTKPNEHDMYHVKFMKSSRTKLHYHTGAQLLIITKGTGSLILYKHSSKSQIRITKTIGLKEGDVAYIPLKILHTHGSIKNGKIFSHIAINFYPNKNNAVKTVWFESDLKSNLFHKIS
tara:strand:+ start:792 stop:1220 length:429 start_codon:yes stop_codon:yes gene_type:complete